MPSRSDVEAGHAFILMRAPVEKLKADLRYARENLKAFGSQVASAGRSLALAGGGLMAPLIGAIKVYSDFTMEMGNVATMVKDTDTHMGRFKDRIREMSVQYGESTATLSKGLYNVLSATVPAAEALDVLEASTRAATAGVTDTSLATEAILSILRSYALEASRAADISDLLFTVVRRGILTFGDLAGHIGLVASTAAVCGLSLEELGASIATMTRGGVRSEHAIVALNNILKSFITPTVASQAVAAKLGIELNTTTLKAIGLVGVMKQIQDLPPGVIGKLFPSLRSLRGIYVLMQDLPGFSEDIDLMGNRAGATDVAFSKIARTFGFLMKRLKEAGKLFLSYVGEAMASSVASLADKVIGIAKGTGEWVKKHKALVATILKAIPVVTTLGLLMMALGKAMMLVAIVSSALTGPGGIAALVTGIVAGVAAFGIISWMTSGISAEIQKANGLLKEQRMRQNDINVAIKSQWLMIRHARLEYEEMWKKAKEAEAHRGKFYISEKQEAFAARMFEQQLTKLRDKVNEANEKLRQLQEMRAKTSKEIAGAEDVLENRAALGTLRTSFLAGFYRVPGGATTSIEAQSLDALEKIEENTRRTADNITQPQFAQ